MIKSQVLLLNVTGKCNLDCPYCFGPKKTEKKLASQKSLEELIAKKAEEGFKTIIFTGGEPLLRKDIAELIAFTKDLGLYTILHTNGILLSKKILEKIKTNIDQINLPLDGFDALTHDSFRGADHFVKVEAALRLLAGKKIKTVISTVAHAQNHQFVELIGKIIPPWIYKWRIFQFKKTRHSPALIKFFSLRERDFKDLQERVKKMALPFKIEFIKENDAKFYQSYEEK